MKTLIFESTLGKAKSTGMSLRTTVPSTIIKLLELNEGDKLTWECNIENDEVHIKVSPKKPS